MSTAFLFHETERNMSTAWPIYFMKPKKIERGKVKEKGKKGKGYVQERYDMLHNPDTGLATL